MLRFLADENIHSKIIAYLRDKNCDVLAVAQEKSLTGCSDYKLTQVAGKEKRIIITADKHFGQLVQLHAEKKKLGLILLRYAFFDIEKIKTGLNKAIDEIKSKNLDKESFVIVLDERKMRVRRY